MPPLDTTRYMLNPPGQARRNDVGEWKRSLDNASSQLEHQYLRILNLELMLKYGDKVSTRCMRKDACTNACVTHVDCTKLCSVNAVKRFVFKSLRSLHAPNSLHTSYWEHASLFAPTLGLLACLQAFIGVKMA